MVNARKEEGVRVSERTSEQPLLLTSSREVRSRGRLATVLLCVGRRGARGGCLAGQPSTKLGPVPQSRGQQPRVRALAPGCPPPHPGRAAVRSDSAAAAAVAPFCPSLAHDRL